jgi:Family of unknown function (DUF6055)
MRRSILAVVAVALAVTLAGPSPTVAAPPAAPEDPALAAVRAIFGETAASARRTDSADRPEASLALRDLFVALPRLDTDDRREAQGYLARPTDGGSDVFGDGYTVPARKKCRNHICIHWVPTTADAPPNADWVRSNLAFANKVWRTEVGQLGYRRPIGDRKRGGNGKLDVYLKDVGSRGVYGYCAPERRAKGRKWLASGYCVLDNDFAAAQFGGAAPRDSMRVTTAHELFHAVQYAYDYGEDPWLMEATATWMEERVADDVNDSRQYLPYGQLGRPAQSLDRFSQQGFNQYGNWAFFEYLSNHYGPRVVRTIWNRAGAFAGAGHQYSTAAVRSALAGRGGFKTVFRAYAAANLAPGRTYGEGKSWPIAPAARTWTVTQAARRASTTLRVNHMASRKVQVRPGSGIKRGWQLQVAVDGPVGRTSPAASLVVKRENGVTAKAIPLNRKGQGRVDVPFGSRRIRSATVVLVNASTRFSCWHRTDWSCQGRARDNRQSFAVTATALAPRRG